jgi:uncharacterized protein HemY
MQSNYDAANVLKKAEDQFVESGDQPGAAQCSQCLGDILYMQSNYKEATNVLKQAQNQFVEIGHQHGTTQSL